MRLKNTLDSVARPNAYSVHVILVPLSCVVDFVQPKIPIAVERLTLNIMVSVCDQSSPALPLGTSRWIPSIKFRMARQDPVVFAL